MNRRYGAGDEIRTRDPLLGKHAGGPDENPPVEVTDAGRWWHDRDSAAVDVNATFPVEADDYRRQLIEATLSRVHPRHLIRDRDRCYRIDFIAKASRIGIHAVLAPVHAPNANAIAERVIGTLRR